MGLYLFHGRFFGYSNPRGKTLKRAFPASRKGPINSSRADLEKVQKTRETRDLLKKVFNFPCPPPKKSDKHLMIGKWKKGQFGTYDVGEDLYHFWFAFKLSEL